MMLIDLKAPDDYDYITLEYDKLKKESFKEKPGMNNWYQRPDPFMAAYVRSIMVLEDFSGLEALTIPLFPNGMPALIWQTGSTKVDNKSTGQLTLSGKTNFPDNLPPGKEITVIAYLFKPYALNTLFEIGASELTTKSIHGKLRQSAKFLALEEELTHSVTTTGMQKLLDSFISDQLLVNINVCRIIQYATDIILLYPVADTLPFILKELDITERTFQRVFKKYVGVTPNQYRRICQFHSGFQQLRKNQFGKLSDIAYENGYADQSHYIRSFKEFTSLTPKDYLKYGLA